MILPLALLTFLHAYIGWRIVPALPGALAPGVFGVLLAVSLAVQVLALAGRQRRQHSRAAADRWSWAGMLAFGAFGITLTLTLLRELLLLVAPGFAAGSAEALPLLALAAAFYGIFSARRTAQVKRVDVPIEGLPAALQGFTIAQITDIHVGPTVKRPYLQAIVDSVNALQADAVAITGDLVDGRVRDLHEDVKPLGELRSRHGTFFVTGNHEYYSGAVEWMHALRKLGLQVLHNEHVVLEHGGSSLVMAGVSDYGAHQFDESHRSDPRRAIGGAPDDAGLRVLLAHQPRSAEGAAAAGFDVQLSGHTHGGQVWPLNHFVPLQQPFTAGLHRLKQLWVYVSRGTGYWGPPMRIGAPSEITELRFVAA